MADYRSTQQTVEVAFVPGEAYRSTQQTVEVAFVPGDDPAPGSEEWWELVPI